MRRALVALTLLAAAGVLTAGCSGTSQAPGGLALAAAPRRPPPPRRPPAPAAPTVVVAAAMAAVRPPAVPAPLRAHSITLGK